MVGLRNAEPCFFRMISALRDTHQSYPLFILRYNLKHKRGLSSLMICKPLSGRWKPITYWDALHGYSTRAHGVEAFRKQPAEYNLRMARYQENLQGQLPRTLSDPAAGLSPPAGTHDQAHLRRQSMRMHYRDALLRETTEMHY